MEHKPIEALEIDLAQSLTLTDYENIAKRRYRVICTNIKSKIEEYRKGLLSQLKKGTRMYGVNTGCGDLVDNTIEDEHLQYYQFQYVLAHNCGTGRPLEKNMVRLIMAIRLRSFALGFSAISVEVFELMMAMLNKDVIPVVLEEGSVGASGDLVPLAMIAAAIIGLEQSTVYGPNNTTISTIQAFKEHDLKPVKLNAKEAMALTNGSNFIASIASFCLWSGKNLIKNAIIAAALSVEAIRGHHGAFSKEIIWARPHPGSIKVAACMRGLLEDSKRSSDEGRQADLGDVQGKQRVQDRYSFRAIPQVLGTVVDSLETLANVLTIEMNSATDNPLIFQNNGEYYAISGANFHGQPIAAIIDYVKPTITAAMLISDKRSFSLLDKNQSFGLPADLAVSPEKGQSGLMIAQYAGAARCANARVLSYPSSVTSISTAANQEDMVSMGSIGVLHLLQIISDAEKVVSIELLCALRGIQLSQLHPELNHLGKGTTEIYKYLSAKLPTPKCDQYLRNDIEEVISIVKDGSLVSLVSKIVSEALSTPIPTQQPTIW